MVYVLDQLLRLDVDGEAWASAAWSTSPASLPEALRASPKAHLLRMHNLFVALLALPRSAVALPPIVFSRDAEDEAVEHDIKLGEVGRRPKRIEGGLHDLAAACLVAVGDVLYR